MVITLFPAVSMQLHKMQLHNLGHDNIIQSTETSLRKQLVQYLQEHSYTHDGSSDYIPAPLLSNDPANADTERPTELDQFIYQHC